MGKTTLAHPWPTPSACALRAVQFTADLMPSDLVGVSVFERGKEPSSSTRPGVRAGAAGRRDQPRQPQDAKRPARSHGGKSRCRWKVRKRACPSPSSSSPRKKPGDQLGTFRPARVAARPLLMRISLGYPDHCRRRRLLLGRRPARNGLTLQPLLTPQELASLQRSVSGGARQRCTLLDYVQGPDRRHPPDAGSSRACRHAPHCAGARAARRRR